MVFIAFVEFMLKETNRGTRVEGFPAPGDSRFSVEMP
jgi:hypothetical protein